MEDAARALGRTPLDIRSRCKELGFAWPRGDVSSLDCFVDTWSFVSALVIYRSNATGNKLKVVKLF